MHNINDRVVLNGVEGTIKYIGPTQFQPGEWIGVELDQPAGKNDGSVAGVRYFQAQDKHGVFVRPAMLQSPNSSDIRLKVIIRSLEDKLLKLRSDMSDLMAQLELSKSTVVSLEESLEREIMEKMTLSDRLAALQDKTNEISVNSVRRGDVDSGQIEHYVKELAKLKESNDQLQSKVLSLADAEVIIDSLTVQNADLTDELSKCKVAIKELESLLELDKDLEQSHLEIGNELRAEIKQAYEKLEQEQAHVKTLETKVAKLNQLLQQKHSQPEKSGVSSESTEKLLSQLKHHDSQILQLKHQLEIQQVLHKAEHLALEEYSNLLSRSEGGSENLQQMAQLVRFKVLCHQFEDYNISQLGQVASIDDYFHQSQCLRDAFSLGRLALEAGCIIKTCEYHREVPSALVKQVSGLLERFDKMLEAHEYHEDLIFPFEGPVKNREEVLKQMLLAVHKLEYCLLLSGLLQDGLSLNGTRYGFSAVKAAIEDLMGQLDGHIRALETLEKNGQGLMNGPNIRFESIDDLFAALCDLDERIRAGEQITLFGEPIRISPTRLTLPEFEIVEIPASTSWFIGHREVQDDTASEKQAQIIEELQMKISVLQAKLSKHQTEELQLIQLSKSFEELQLENQKLNKEYMGAQEKYKTILKQLDETTKKLQLYGDDKTRGVYEEFMRLDKMQLINEISSLRTLVTKLDTSRTIQNRDLQFACDLLPDLSPIKWDLGTNIEEMVSADELSANIKHFQIPKITENNSNALNGYTKMLNILMG
ncbi:hypothetical protein KL918_000932 [Ogataea parapolymorpha]|uniref:CAP-Gly domain-containing linker protein 1 n=1 Tax=Ogataea parapolymorpha (strain ATCC 26012 / BCRC 20466 / JCM 22074 / NRRL Y-7560 / DL-1) TaxID=871575 RepID=W1Q915_OGAPD|nr:CAP-Gly domain-containing linker protein 1 [Ogataea parapolymorpha DL-1]ESW97325.1 CAP-Gly domain-containing linker protein 1 [Ogataea parapolymorpha DL-1]KAG7869387.1 hypothetical protein KL918_000932 [Ogataea parapolymorpha]KAG7875561.1 hypothetical protein KL916_000232 [Ogataea parapolymorpha]